MKKKTIVASGRMQAEELRIMARQRAIGDSIAGEIDAIVEPRDIRTVLATAGATTGSINELFEAFADPRLRLRIHISLDVEER